MKGWIIAILWLVSAAGRAIADARESLPAPADVAGRGECVLVVDDEADILRTLAQLLRDSGYQVVSAASGTDAIAVATSRRPDIALLDFAMPGMNGVELAERLRAFQPHLPVLFVSGHAELDVLEAAVPRAHLLRKPFRTEDLYGALRRCLASSGGSG